MLEKEELKYQGIRLLIALILLCVLGPLAVPITGDILFTLQTFFVLLPAALFGWKLGLLNVSIYLILGGIGLPVFAGYVSGFNGPTIGYLLAFIPAAMVVGYWAQNSTEPSYFFLFMLFLLAHVFIIAIGMGVQLYITEGYLQDQLSLLKKLFVGGLIKSAIGALIVLFQQEKRGKSF